MKRTRDFIEENVRWIVAAVLLIILLSVLSYFVSNIKGDDTDLIVDEVFFNHIEMEGAESDLKISVLLTNEGENEIDDVMVRAFVIERDSNLARDEDRAEVGGILGKTTKEADLFISVPNNDTYRIEILVFEDSKLTLRGSGTIDLVGVGVASEYAGADDDDDMLDDSSIGWGSGDADSQLLGILCFFILLLIIGVVVLVVLLVNNQSKKKSIRSPGTAPVKDTRPPWENEDMGPTQ